MVKLIKEYLSLLQFLLYRAQKRQKIKQILKCQKILYQSKSLILLLFCFQRLKSFQQKKLNKSLSDYFFHRILKFFFFKKKNQNFSFFYSEFKLNKKLKNINFIENFQYFYNYSLFLDFHYKQIFSINLIFLYNPIKLSYFYLLNNFKNIVLLRTFQYEFFNIIYYFIFLFLQKNSILFFDVSSKQEYILKNKSILCLFFIEANYPLFFYSKFYYFYYHNNLLDCEKIQYQQNYYFDYLSDRKYQFFFNENKISLNLNSKVVKKLNSRILKNPFFCYYSIICTFPFFRQNSGYFSIKFFNNFSFHNYFFHNCTKKSLQKLKKIQKQILLLIFEPIWEAFFEISLYSNRRGRSLYDVIEFLRLNIKQQPIFLFKTYLTFVNKNFYKTKKYQKNIIDPFLIFFCFFENIFFHGIQKKYQNFYLITKQQILLYQILKIFKQNKKNKISFYKIFFNNKFLI